MRMESNTMLITGGGSGIGRGLAEAFHRRGNRVIIAGRREAVLKETAAANPGMRYLVLDVTDPESIRQATLRAAAEFPTLDCLINNSGIQRHHDFSAGQPIDDAAMMDELNTNVVGLVRMCAAFVPLLQKQPSATLVNVSSGLAFVPLARFPIYCATKAAVHSFTLSLRHQLRNSTVKVVELVPPYVATALGKHSEVGWTAGPQPMPLEQFIIEAMQALASGADEAAVGTATARVAAVAEATRAAFGMMNR